MDLKANLKWSYCVRKKVLKNHNVKEGKKEWNIYDVSRSKEEKENMK